MLDSKTYKDRCVNNSEVPHTFGSEVWVDNTFISVIGAHHGCAHWVPGRGTI